MRNSFEVLPNPEWSLQRLMTRRVLLLSLVSPATLSHIASPIDVTIKMTSTSCFIHGHIGVFAFFCVLLTCNTSAGRMSKVRVSGKSQVQRHFDLNVTASRNVLPNLSPPRCHNNFSLVSLRLRLHIVFPLSPSEHSTNLHSSLHITNTLGMNPPPLSVSDEKRMRSIKTKRSAKASCSEINCHDEHDAVRSLKRILASSVRNDAENWNPFCVRPERKTKGTKTN